MMRNGEMNRGQMLRVIAFLAGCAFAAVPWSAAAMDIGVGRRTAAIAEIDLTSAVAGSTQVRALPSQEGETGKIEIRDVQPRRRPKVLGKGNTAADGQYQITVAAPLRIGQIIQAVNTRLGFQSSGVEVVAAAAPRLDEPIAAGATSVRGHGTPGHRLQILNPISGDVLGQATPVSPGTGQFEIGVAALPLFHSIQAVDASSPAQIKGAVVPILNLPRLPPGFALPQPPNNCARQPGPRVLRGFSATRFQCQLPLPRGIAVGPDQSVFVVAGAPPSDLVLVPPLGVFQFSPGDGSLQLFSPVTGVGLRFASEAFGKGLFVARPRVFNLRQAVITARDDGELFTVNTETREAAVYTRLLDIAPSGIAFDTTSNGSFAGDMVISNFLGSRVARVRASDKMVSTLVQNLPGIQGLAFGNGGGFGTDLYAAQPGSGKILRITPRGDVSALIANLASPVDLAFGPGGRFGTDLYVTDAGSGRVLRVNANGEATVFASGLQAPFGLTFAPTPAALLVTDYATGDVVRIAISRSTVRKPRPARQR